MSEKIHTPSDAFSESSRPADSEVSSPERTKYTERESEAGAHAAKEWMNVAVDLHDAKNAAMSGVLNDKETVYDIDQQGSLDYLTSYAERRAQLAVEGVRDEALTEEEHAMLDVFKAETEMTNAEAKFDVEELTSEQVDQAHDQARARESEARARGDTAEARKWQEVAMRANRYNELVFDNVGDQKLHEEDEYKLNRTLRPDSRDAGFVLDAGFDDTGAFRGNNFRRYAKQAGVDAANMRKTAQLYELFAEVQSQQPEGESASESKKRALEDSLEGMRTRETIQTRELARIDVADGVHVDFTALEHYTPPVVPGTEAYPVPDHVRETLLTEEHMDTYLNTVDKPGWEQDVRSVIEEYVTRAPDGAELAQQLGIESLDHLTPEQAVKLSVALVQNVSKYSWDDLRAQRESEADRTGTADLLREGITQRDNPEWQGNGICRNISSNVKAVFESLKATQAADTDMLRNTYASVDIGYNGKGYRNTRDTRGDSGPITEGHAWNIFTTVDRDGSAVATIIDVTSALQNTVPSVEQSIDMTTERVASKMGAVVEKSQTPDKALLGYREYIDSIVKQGYKQNKLTFEGKRQLQDFAFSEYMSVAGRIPNLTPGGEYISDSIASLGSRLRKDLSSAELATLYRLNKQSDVPYDDKMQFIIDGYSKARVAESPGGLAFADRQLQSSVLDVLGKERAAAMAKVDPSLNDALRRLRPAWLI